MMRARFVTAGLLCVALVLTTLGWVGASTSKPFAGQTINVIVCSDPFADAERALIPQFEQETGIKVNFEPLAFVALQEKLMINFVSKSPAYDVISMFCGWDGEWEKAGWVEDLTPRLKTLEDPDDLLPGSLAAWKWNGKLLAIPCAPYYYLVFYRSELFEKAGLAPPKTLDDWRKVGKTFTKPQENLFGWCNAYQRGGPIVHDSVAYLTGLGGSLLKDPANGNFKPSLYSPVAVEVYTFYKEMLQYAPPGCVTFDWQQRSEAYDQGRVAAQGNWSAMCAARKDPTKAALPVTKYTKYAGLPVAKAGDPPKVPFGGWGLAINAYSKKKDAAWEFIKWFSQKRIMPTYIKEGGGPFRFSTLRDPALRAANEWFEIIEKAELSGGVLIDYLPRIPEWSKMEEIYGQHMNAIMIGKVSVEEGLKAADKEVEALLKAAGYPMK